MPRGTPGGEWLAASWTAAGLASGLGRALGGSSPLDPPSRDASGDAAGTTAEDDDPFGPLPPLDPDAEWDDVDALDEIPVAEPAQLPLDAFAEAPQEGLADKAPAGDDAPLLLSEPPEPELLPPPAPEVAPQAAPAERESQPACGVAAAPPGPSTPPNEEEAAAWSSGLTGWDPTQLLPAAQREELAAAAASLRAGLPGGGNPASLVGTALLGTTDGALRGFAGLMNNGRGGNKPRD